MKHSAICDPDHFILKERQDEIEGYISNYDYDPLDVKC